MPPQGSEEEEELIEAVRRTACRERPVDCTSIPVNSMVRAVSQKMDTKSGCAWAMAAT